MLAPPTKDNNHQEHERQIGHHGVDVLLRLDDCLTVVTLASGSRDIGLYPALPPEICLQHGDDLNGVDHRSLLGQVLNRVQMGNNARIVHGAGLRQPRLSR